MRLREFAPASGGNSGDYLKALASAWYNGVFDTGSLPRGIKTQEDVERLLNRGIVCPDGKTRKLHIDYNSDFDGVEIYSDDYYEHGDLDGNDGRTGQPWGPYDHMEFKDEELDEGVVEATGDQKFDSMMSRMTAEPKYPDQDMPPTSIDELIQWADRNNKPYHEYFAQWARRNGFKNVNDALVWFGDNVDPSNPWGPKDFLDPFGRPAAEELEDAAKHDPKAAELMKVFRCYEEIVFDWPDEYRQMNMPVSRKGTDEGVAEGIETVHGKKYNVDPDKYYVWAWDGAAVLYGEYDDIQDAKINLPRIEQRAIKRLGPFAKDKFEIASGKDLLRRYEKSGVAEGSLNEDEYDKMLRDLIKKNPGVLKTYSNDVKKSKDIESGKALDKLVKKNPGVLKTYSNAVKKDKKLGMEGVAEGLNEFAPGGGEGGEEDALHKYAKMWWAGDEATQMQIERALAKMGWEIGEDEGSYDNGGVFVVRAGDVNGRSYQSWPAEELTEGSDPWGPEGRFVGDTGPTQVSTTVPRVQLRIGDRVVYKPTEQRARIEDLSRDGTQARIHIATPMGGRTFNCQTSDLKQLANETEIDRLKNLAGIKESHDLCNVCGQTPCNCTHLSEEFDLIESIVEKIAVHNGVDADVIWEDLQSLSDDELYVFAVTSEPIMEDWQKVNKQDRTSGMSRKAVKAYRREHPGSKLKTAVTTKPSKLKRGSKASKRRKSYCSRSRGQMKMHNISCAKTPDKAICKARRRWNC